MKLEAGKRYVMRNGGVTGPLQEIGGDTFADEKHFWGIEGKVYSDGPTCEADIMWEYVEVKLDTPMFINPAPHAAAPLSGQPSSTMTVRSGDGDQLGFARALLEAAGYTVIPPKPKLEGWVNVYVRSGQGWADYEWHPTREEAEESNRRVVKLAPDSTRIACIHFTEGEGL